MKIASDLGPAIAASALPQVALPLAAGAFPVPEQAFSALLNAGGTPPPVKGSGEGPLRSDRPAWPETAVDAQTPLSLDPSPVAAAPPAATTFAPVELTLSDRLEELQSLMSPTPDRAFAFGSAGLFGQPTTAGHSALVPAELGRAPPPGAAPPLETSPAPQSRVDPGGRRPAPPTTETRDIDRHGAEPAAARLARQAPAASAGAHAEPAQTPSPPPLAAAPGQPRLAQGPTGRAALPPAAPEAAEPPPPPTPAAAAPLRLSGFLATTRSGAAAPQRDPSPGAASGAAGPAPTPRRPAPFASVLSVIIQEQGARLNVVLAGPGLGAADRARLRDLTVRLLGEQGRAFDAVSFNGEALTSTSRHSGGSGGRLAR